MPGAQWFPGAHRRGRDGNQRVDTDGSADRSSDAAPFFADNPGIDGGGRPEMHGPWVYRRMNWPSGSRLVSSGPCQPRNALILTPPSDRDTVLKWTTDARLRGGSRDRHCPDAPPAKGPPPTARGDAPAGASTPLDTPPAASPTPPPAPAPPRRSPTRAAPTSQPPFSSEARPRPGREARTRTARSRNSRHAPGDPSPPTESPRPPPARSPACTPL
jgi:hypothetical protein